MYSEYYEAIDFKTYLKSQEELDAALFKAVRDPDFAIKFAEDTEKQCFLGWDHVGTKKTHQRSQYLNLNDMRFSFMFNKGKIDCIPEREDYEISNPGNTMDYLEILIKKLISKKDRTCIISQSNEGDNEKYGVAIERGCSYELDFSPRVITDDNRNPELSDWINKE